MHSPVRFLLWMIAAALPVLSSAAAPLRSAENAASAQSRSNARLMGSKEG